MPFILSPGLDGYHACIRTSFSSEALIYTSNMMMTQRTSAPPLRQGGEPWGDVSSANVIVVGEKGHFLLAGALTAFRSLTIFRAVCDNNCITAIEMTQPDIRPGESPEETLVLEGEDWRALLKQYAETAARRNGVGLIPAKRNMTGYCSWYYYYDKVTEAQMRENVAALGANRNLYVAEYAQIDDGYQTFQGDWLDQGEMWPHPLKDIASEIMDSGMKAGIWTMPATASTASRVYREHPDWFVKDTSGETVVQRGWSPEPNHLWACLDATIPEVREHIAHIFKTFRTWGFTYFKMDGLTYGLQRGVRRDPQATVVSAYRMLLKTIRDAVPDAVIMGCNAPFLPSLGLIDNCRVSNDTSRSFWQDAASESLLTCGCNILDAFHVSMANFWMFDRWFRADPDVVMARQDNAFYSRNQAKFSVLAGIMTGVSLTSDHLGTIDAERLKLLAKAQNIRMRDVQPLLDTPPYAWPMVYEGSIDGQRAVAVVNDTLQVRTWRMQELGMSENCFDLLDEKPICGKLRLESEDAVLLVKAHR